METCRKNQEIPKNDSIEDEVELWDNAIRLAMETPLPLFHRYTRSEALDALRMSPDALFLLPDTKRPKMEKTTHIADMDPELQIELYNMSSIDEDFSGRYDEILKEIGCANYEIRFMKIYELVMAGNYNRAEAGAKQLLKESGDQTLDNQLEHINNHRDIADDAEDFEEEFFGRGARSFDMNGPDDSPNVNDSLAQLFGFPNEYAASGNGTRSGIAADGFWNQPSGTYKRVQPKVGRNDPCPCGSGKKYKHCCGR